MSANNRLFGVRGKKEKSSSVKYERNVAGFSVGEIYDTFINSFYATVGV